MFFSLIIPVYNRPHEISELLESLTKQSYKYFEILVIEDGSLPELRCETLVKAFADRLNIRYFFKENSGQGFTRNFAFAQARGNYFVIFDSDVLVPPHYLETVKQAVETQNLDAYGGPDAALPDFTPIQRAISYSMTSVFTTGGIRGRKKNMGGTFHPRSFNMGLSKKVYDTVGGFLITRMAEDLEFSIRIIRAGFKVGLIPDAFVYHKRRTSLGQFFRQLHFFGRARINLSRFFPDELKIVHFFPMAFACFCVLIPLWGLVFPPFFWLSGALLLLFVLAIFIDSLRQNRSLEVALLSIPAAFTQLWGYGLGFMQEGWEKLTEK